jgi:regulatory protein YycI of two-component signal transduction system YycFG
MDWTKAKTILIIALLTTNLVLGGALGFRDFGVAAKENVPLEDILADRNIFLETGVPENYPAKMPVLFVEYENTDYEAVEKALENQGVLLRDEWSEQKIRAAADKVLTESGLMTENVVFSHIEKGDESEGAVKIVYKNTKDGISIEESYISCDMTNGRIAEVERKWLKPVGVHEKKGEIISPLSALLQLLSDKEESEELHVEKIELVYWLNPDDMGIEAPVDDTALPAWKITCAGEEPRYVTAFERS